MSKTILAQRLRQLRKEKGLTQIEISGLIKISNTTLSQYESGKRMPCFEVLFQLCEIYESTTDYILGMTDERLLPCSSISITQKQTSVLETIKRVYPPFFDTLVDCSSLTKNDLEIISQITKSIIELRQENEYSFAKF